jgi:hypothetical protein
VWELNSSDRSVITEGLNRIGDAMSAITAKLRRIVGGHGRAGGRILDIWSGTRTAESNRPVVVKGNHCAPAHVTQSRYLEPSSFDTLRRARR